MSFFLGSLNFLCLKKDIIIFQLFQSQFMCYIPYEVIAHQPPSEHLPKFQNLLMHVVFFLFTLEVTRRRDHVFFIFVSLMDHRTLDAQWH
jgi:hypothetical protein